MQKPELIVSPVGTSLLTNSAPDDLRKQLLSTANAKESELTSEQKNLIDTRTNEVREKLLDADFEEWKKMSAELNGILTRKAPNKADVCVMVGTDTYQGRKTSDVLVEALKKRFGCIVWDPYIPNGLSTSSKEGFNKAMTDFAKWCEEQLSVNQQAYKIVFNLTGGFKSVLGVMTVLGMVYADEISYVFESSKELITIPKLPIQFDTACLKNCAAPMELLFAEDPLPYNSADFSVVPDIYIERADELVSLNTYGRVVWNKVRKKILADELLNWPLIEYTKGFNKDFENIKDGDFKAAIQEAVAKASATLISQNKNINELKKHPSLLYEEYINRDGIAHFRVDDSRRISCEWVGGILKLRHVGEHNYVNDNP